ncbi:hypothetical protein ALC60_00941 [Trachymyrmex zeteki]|uniref:Uncharacterized protein n=1 Tax=Mycetomoellerius zeteki TaxID=64791 RepID=A0A151XHY4_9HYME|nr:hypothetical protein ALC60_00941 [Trachymyrmex zeteki]
MAFIGVEFVSDEKLDSGAIALVHLTWLTPRKKEVWWPPYKTSSRFKKALSVGEEPREDTWTLCQVDRILFSCSMLYIYIYTHILYILYTCLL